MEEPLTQIDLLEMDLEWMAIVDEMNLGSILGKQGYTFSAKLFKEAYIRGFKKGCESRQEKKLN